VCVCGLGGGGVRVPLHLIPLHAHPHIFLHPIGSLQEFSQLIGFEAYSRFGYAMATLGDISGDGLSGMLYLPCSDSKL